jgi:hypothetical protein
MRRDGGRPAHISVALAWLILPLMLSVDACGAAKAACRATIHYAAKRLRGAKKSLAGFFQKQNLKSFFKKKVPQISPMVCSSQSSRSAIL